jgi:hypothetical protein
MCGLGNLTSDNIHEEKEKTSSAREGTPLMFRQDT